MKGRIFVYLGLVLILGSCSNQALEYKFFEGPIHGTSFHITYEYYENKNLDEDILTLMEDFELSLSTYNPESIISRINANQENVEVDAYFRTVFNRSMQISKLTNGAFDITVAPVVNAYGFGFTERQSVTDDLIAELLSFSGYKNVRIENNLVVKNDPRLMLDVAAIAKGYSVDVVAEFLENHGVINYLVEIGGEMRCKGQSSKGLDWKVGIDKPIENMIDREIQVVINLKNGSLATSGNYRQFYEVDNIKYSHTIDPIIGKPVRHNLLSATVLTRDCMSADAYATAFMVLGLEKSLEIVESNPDLEAYFIYSDEKGAFLSSYTKGLEGIINEDY